MGCPGGGVNPLPLVPVKVSGLPHLRGTMKDFQSGQNTGGGRGVLTIRFHLFLP